MMPSPVSRREAETFVGLLQTLLRGLTIGSNDPAAALPLAQLRVCHVLRSGGRSITSIGRELGVSASAVTQIADRLERAKLVCREAGDGDRRVRRLRLTKQGENLLRRHDEERVRRAAAMLERMPPKARREAAAALKQLGLAANAARGEDGDGRLHPPHFSTSKVSP